MKILVLLAIIFSFRSYAGFGVEICESSSVQDKLRTHFKFNLSPEVVERSLDITLVADEPYMFMAGSCKFVYRTSEPVDERVCDDWYRVIYIHPTKIDMKIEDDVDYSGWCDY